MRNGLVRSILLDVHTEVNINFEMLHFLPSLYLSFFLGNDPAFGEETGSKINEGSSQTSQSLVRLCLQFRCFEGSVLAQPCPFCWALVSKPPSGLGPGTEFRCRVEPRRSHRSRLQHETTQVEFETDGDGSSASPIDHLERCFRV